MITLIVDGNSWACRSYYALKKQPFGIPVSPDGQPIAACSVVVPSILRLCFDYYVDKVVVAFDSRGETFRHKLFPDYKKKRKDKPFDEKLATDIAQLADLLALMNIAIVAPEGYEADDVIASVATQIGGDILIHSADRDMFQLVNDRRILLYPSSRGNATMMNANAVKAQTGVFPASIPDYKALIGDKSDCIPGIKGIGIVKGLELLNKYQTIEQMYDDADNIPGKEGRLIRSPGMKEQVLMFKKIATTVADLQLDLGSIGSIEPEPAASTLEKLGLNSIAETLRNYRSNPVKAK